MNISVAMAVYNGEKYLEQQVDSIMCQLDETDELIISYNKSTDNTVKVLEGLSKKYPSIKIYLYGKKGMISNFENAILHCTKDIIFLSAQDDVWNDNKVEEVMKVFNADPTVLTVVHNCEYVDEDLNSLGKDLFHDRKSKVGLIRNIIRNGYQGNCMAFRKDLIPFITPMPETIEVHDQWIGLMSERAGHIKFLDEKLIKYRKYEGTNSTVKYSIFRKLLWRYNMATHVFDVLNEKKMLKWYLQSIYAPEKKGSFDNAYGYNEEEAKENKEKRDAIDKKVSDANSETMMYVVDDITDKANEQQ